ncbi:MAG: hypothetical protein LQ346_005926 [Caloplaca aetnensis]|nr:MAG: hypothetical protein LQ346_005926 [Caloplaca aetnensis]
MEDPHHAAQIWSYRVPSPPRLIIPPAPLDRKGAPDVHIRPSNNHKFDASGFSNTEFLATVTYGDCSANVPMHEWKYEHRWNAQIILPFLFLGPISAARSHDFLRQNSITMLLAVRDFKSARARLLGSKAALEIGIPLATVDTTGHQELIAAFPRGIEIINTHLSAMYERSQNNPASNKASPPGKVLVFCESGNERSAAMVVAYIMAMYSMDVVRAIQFVHAQRFAVAFDDATKLLLQNYHAILSAQRDVYRSQQASANPARGRLAEGNPGMSRKPSKRTLDDAYDDEDDMEVDWDGARADPVYEKRIGSAPFLTDGGN